MKKLAMLFAIVATQTMAFDKEVENLTITVNKPNTIQVYRGSQHLFSEDCSDFGCKILTTNTEHPVINTEDGWVQLNADVNELTQDNIKAFSLYHWSDHSYVSFIVSQASVPGTQSVTTQYLIDTVNGSVSIKKEESDFFINGLPDTRVSF